LKPPFSKTRPFCLGEKVVLSLSRLSMIPQRSCL
jgi:hypothetical protein